MNSIMRRTEERTLVLIFENTDSVEIPLNQVEVCQIGDIKKEISPVMSSPFLSCSSFYAEILSSANVDKYAFNDEKFESYFIFDRIARKDLCAIEIKGETTVYLPWRQKAEAYYTGENEDFSSYINKKGSLVISVRSDEKSSI